MINHARTLLLNIDGSNTVVPSFPGEEYIPPGFKATSMPVELARIRNSLFGNNPDRAMLNYRLRQYMALVHSTELAQYFTALDSRITYWPLADESLMNRSLFAAIPKLLSGSSSWSIHVIGDPNTLKKASVLLDKWKVVVQNSSTVQVTHLLEPFEVATHNLTFTSSISNVMSLPGSTMSFTLSPGTTPLPTWEIEHLARPILDLSDVYAGLTSGVDIGLEALFEGDKEPYKTCRTLWGLQFAPIAYKLGAVIVALAYRINELHEHQN